MKYPKPEQYLDVVLETSNAHIELHSWLLRILKTESRAQHLTECSTLLTNAHKKNCFSDMFSHRVQIGCWLRVCLSEAVLQRNITSRASPLIRAANESCGSSHPNSARVPGSKRPRGLREGRREPWYASIRSMRVQHAGTHGERNAATRAQWTADT